MLGHLGFAHYHGQLHPQKNEEGESMVYTNMPRVVACVLLIGLLSPAGLTAQTSCDFDTDLSCGIADLNAILAVGPVAPGVPVTHDNQQYDLTGDDVINNDDVAAWLAEAGSLNLGRPYLPGDANLDGFVDRTDLDMWIDGKFTQTLRWDGGDFSGDGINDGEDFILWNANKFTSSANVSAVPEPNAGIFVFVGLMSLVITRRR
jgi:hypothetical protein